MGNNGVRVFNINGIDLYVHYDKENRNTMFIMKTQDAQENFLPITQERASEEKLPFNSALFSNNIAPTVVQ